MTGPALFGVRPADAQEPKELFAAAKAAVEKGGLRTVDVTMDAAFRKDAPCTLTVRDADGHAATVSGPVPEAARNRAVTAEELEARLKKTAAPLSCEQYRVGRRRPVLPPRGERLRRDGLAVSALRTAPPKRGCAAGASCGDCALENRR